MHAPSILKIFSATPIFLKRDEATGEWRKLHNKELNDPYSPSNIVRVIKSRRMKWVGHVARMGERRDVYKGFGGESLGKETIWKTQK